MAIPFIFPLLAALAGTGLQVAGNAQAQRAAESATAAEVARQRRLQQEAQAAAWASQQQSTPQAVKGTIKRGQDQAAQSYSKIEQIPLSANQAQQPVQQNATAVNDTRKQADTSRSNTARANVMGYNEWDLQRQIKNLLANSQLNMINNFSQGSQNVLGSELQSAAHAGDSLSGIGQIVGTLGALGSMANMFAAPARVASAGSAFNPGSLDIMPTPVGGTPGGFMNYGQLGFR